MLYVNDSSRVWHVAKTGNDSNSGHAGQYPVNLANDAKLTVGAAVSAASSGDAIIIWPGDYAEAVDASAKALKFIGTSRAKSRIIPASGTALKLASDSEVHNLSLDGSAGSLSYGLEADSKSNIMISGCDTYGAYDGIHASGASQLLLEKCRIRGKYDGGNLTDASGVIARRCFFQGLGTYGTSVHCRALFGVGTGVYENCVFQASRSDTSIKDVGAVTLADAVYAVFDHCVFDAVGGANVTGKVFGVKAAEYNGTAVLSHCLVKARSLRYPPTTIYDLWQYSSGKIVVVGSSYAASSGTIVQGGDGWSAGVKGQAGAAIDEDAGLQKAIKMLLNKAVQDKLTGAIQYYDDDGQTVILTHSPSEDESSIRRVSS